MKIASHLILAASLLLFAACAEEKTSQDAIETATSPSTLPVTASDSTSSQVPSGLPSTGTSAPAPAGALNPAHGEPGHRCEIAVGAPLNSSPSPSPSPSPSTPSPTVTAPPAFNQQPAMQPASPSTSASTGKVNPAHGQPGHDCSVAVGAPLK
jgi:hypothetical protein